MKEEFNDSKKQIRKAIKDSAEIAIAESKALGLPITYQRGTEIIREHADGTIEILGKVEANSKGYKIGQKLYVKDEN